MSEWHWQLNECDDSLSCQLAMAICQQVRWLGTCFCFWLLAANRCRKSARPVSREFLLHAKAHRLWKSWAALRDCGMKNQLNWNAGNFLTCNLHRILESIILQPSCVVGGLITYNSQTWIMRKIEIDWIQSLLCNCNIVFWVRCSRTAINYQGRTKLTDLPSLIAKRCHCLFDHITFAVYTKRQLLAEVLAGLFLLHTGSVHGEQGSNKDRSE